MDGNDVLLLRRRGGGDGGWGNSRLRLAQFVGFGATQNLVFVADCQGPYQMNNVVYALMV